MLDLFNAAFVITAGIGLGLTFCGVLLSLLLDLANWFEGKGE